MTSTSDAGFKPIARVSPPLTGLAVVACLVLVATASGAQSVDKPSNVALPPLGPISTAAERADQVERDRVAGVSAFERGDFPVATAFFRRVRQIDPSNDEGMFLLGRAYLAIGDAAGAVDQLTDAIALNGKVEKYYYARAKAEMRIGKYAAAVADFNLDFELRGGKGSATFYMSRGDAYLDNAELSPAIKDYGEVLAEGGDQRLAFLHRGVAKARTGDMAGALNDLDAAEAAGKAVAAVDFDTYFYRGVVEQLSGDTASALADYRTALTFKHDLRPQAQCLVDVLERKRYGLFNGPSRLCRDFDAGKALALPPDS
jgi:tetratricopeptide (TPR) repeat protein